MVATATRGAALELVLAPHRATSTQALDEAGRPTPAGDDGRAVPDDPPPSEAVAHLHPVAHAAPGVSTVDGWGFSGVPSAAIADAPEKLFNFSRGVGRYPSPGARMGALLPALGVK